MNHTTQTIISRHLIGHNSSITCIAWSPDGKIIASGGFGYRDDHGSTLFLWDTHTSEILFDLIGHPHNISSVAFSPDSTRIVSASYAKHNNLIIWDLP